VLSAESRSARRARELLAVRTACGAWLAFAATLLALIALPGADRSHAGAVIACAGVSVAWAVVIMFLPNSRRLAPLFVLAPLGGLVLCGVATWATGGAGSAVRGLPLLTVVYASWFYDSRAAVRVLAAAVLTTLVPFAYDAHALDAGPLGWTLVLLTGLLVAGGVMIVARRELVRLRDVARAEALRDPLTEVANRRALVSALHRHVRTSARARMGVVLLDLDGLKAINTRHGHAGGDAALVAAARALRDAARGEDVVARLGGDEFALLLPGADRAGLEGVAARAVEGIAAATAVGPGDTALALSASAGVALYPEDAATPDELLAVADARLAAAKAAGKRRVVAGPMEVVRTAPPPDPAPEPHGGLTAASGS